MSRKTQGGGNESSVEPPGQIGKRAGTASKLLNGVAVLGAMGVFIALGAGGITALHLKARADDPHQIAPPIGVVTRPISLEEGYNRVAHYTGRLEPARETNLAFERAGLVRRVLRDEGDWVSKGEVVATLDTAQVEVGRKRLEARKRELKIQLDLAELTLERQSELEKRGWSPEQRLDEARSGRARLLAAIEQVEAEIAAIEIDLTKSKLRAPFDGRVAARFVDEGAVLAAGTSVIRLLEDGRRQARIGLPPRLATTLSGDKTYTLVSGSNELSGKLSARRPDLQTGTRTVTVLFDIEKGSEGIALGDLVRLDVKSRVDERGAWVPLTALKEGRRGMWTLLTVDRRFDQAPVIKTETVEVLHVRGQDVFVRGTFKDGAEIVTDGTDRVVAGQRIARVRE